MCKISIVIPVYNKCEYIEKIVHDILRQTFDDFELLLINDGSLDGSGKICDELAQKDKRIKVFHKENGGVSSARNLGIYNSNGKYICFIDADDSIDDTYLEMLYTSIEKSDSDLAVCNYYEVINNSRKIHGLRQHLEQNELFEIIRYDLLCVLWNKLFIRSKIKHLFDEKLSTCEDSIFCIQYYLDNKAKISWVNDVLYEYRRGDLGLSSKFRIDSFDGINALFSYNVFLSNKLRDSEIKRMAMHHSCRVYFYGIYTYIFETLDAKQYKGNLGTLKNILKNEKYRRVLKYLLKAFLLKWDVERLSFKELSYALFSLIRMPIGIYAIVILRKMIKSSK